MPTIAQQWVEQGIAIGEKRGLQKGRQAMLLETLYQILIIRFEVVLGDYDERFEMLDLKSLKELSKVALTVQTLAEFEKALTNVLSTKL